MKFTELYAVLLQCNEAFERLVTGSGFYLQTGEGKAKLENLAQKVGELANNITVELMLKREELKLDKGLKGGIGKRTGPPAKRK